MEKYRQIDLSEWRQVGAGYNGEAYVSDAYPGKLLKIVRGFLSTETAVVKEFNAPRLLHEVGLPSPETYEIVRHGEDYGYLCQNIEGKKSFGRLCEANPERIPEYAAQMAQWGKVFHQTAIEAGPYVTSMKDMLRKALETSPIVSEENRVRLKEVVEAMPDSKTCLHGDFQVGNIIVAGDKHYWIDLGWFSQGYYLMDLGHMYKMMVEDSVIPMVEGLTHMTRPQMLAFWEAFVKAYTGQEDVDTFNNSLKPYAALDAVRSFYLHATENPQLKAYLAHCVELNLA